MPRKPGIWYRSFAKAYYTTVLGKPTHLASGPDDEPSGPTYRAAQDAFDRLFSSEARSYDQLHTPLGTVIRRFLGSTATDLASNTAQKRSRFLLAFLRGKEDKPAGDLSPLDILLHLEELQARKVKPTSLHTYSAHLQVFTTWASKAGYCREDLMSLAPSYPVRSCSRDRLLTPEDHDRILAVSDPEFGALCEALEATGARPNELFNATAAAYDPDLPGLVYHAAANVREGEHTHKTARKGKSRLITFTGTALDSLQQRARVFRGGFLYHPLDAPQWNGKNADHHVMKARRATGIEHFTLYCYRHTWATNYLLAGGTAETLATILGNSIQIIMHHYAHLLQKKKAIGDAVRAFRERSCTKRATKPRIA